MEVSLSLCLVVLSTLLALSFFKLTAKRMPQKQLPAPPGPWTLPIIGSIHHLIGGPPHRRLTQLSRRYGPLMLLRFGEVPTVIISSADAAALVMKTNDLVFANRPRSTTLDIVSCGGRGIGLAPYGDHWRQMRKVCVVELLSSKQVSRLEGIRAQEVGNLIHSITSLARAGATINVSKKLSALSNDVVSRAVFGGRCVRQDDYLREMDEVVAMLGFCLVDIFPSSWLVRWLTNGERNMKKSCGRMQRIISDVIDERKAARAARKEAYAPENEDLLDVLLRLQEEDTLTYPLTSETMGVVIFDIFNAATETTATVLEWAMSELLNNPEVMAGVQSEIREVLGKGRAIITNADLDKIHNLQMVIKEVLRTHPPAPLLLPRETREDCEIMGYGIPKGTNVFVNAFAISRDPTLWDNPEEFKPERFKHNNVDYYGTHFKFTPFGAGRRQCPGILFGTSTVEIALANILYHFDWINPNGEGQESLDMSEKSGFGAGRRSDLELLAIPPPSSVENMP